MQFPRKLCPPKLCQLSERKKKQSHAMTCVSVCASACVHIESLIKNFLNIAKRFSIIKIFQFFFRNYNFIEILCSTTTFAIPQGLMCSIATLSTFKYIYHSALL